MECFIVVNDTEKQSPRWNPHPLQGTGIERERERGKERKPGLSGRAATDSTQNQWLKKAICSPAQVVGWTRFERPEQISLSEVGISVDVCVGNKSSYTNRMVGTLTLTRCANPLKSVHVSARKIPRSLNIDPQTLDWDREISHINDWKRIPVDQNRVGNKIATHPVSQCTRIEAWEIGPFQLIVIVNIMFSFRRIKWESYPKFDLMQTCEIRTMHVICDLLWIDVVCNPVVIGHPISR